MKIIDERERQKKQRQKEAKEWRKLFITDIYSS